MRLSEIVVVFSNDDISFKTFCNKQLSSVIKQFHGKITEKVHKSKMHKLWESHSKLNHKERDVGEVEKDEQCLQNNERKGMYNKVQSQRTWTTGQEVTKMI